MTDQPNYCDRVPGVVHTAADHDACERRRINALRDATKCDCAVSSYVVDLPVASPPPRVTVSGNGLTVFRLDAEGNPVGEGLRLDSAVRLNIPDDKVDDVLSLGDLTGKTMSIDMNLCDVSPKLLAILTGQYLYTDIPTEVWVSVPWWRRLFSWRKKFRKVWPR